MSVTLTAPEERVHQSAYPEYKLWTRKECEHLERYGFLKPERYELIEGVIINKVPKNPPHSRAATRLLLWLARILGEVVLTETTIDVAPEDTPTSRPEPDLVVLTHSLDEISARIRPAEIRMLVEVSDTTLAFDMGIKAALYARAGIPEYWVIDINARRIIIHRDPAEGRYRSITAYSEDESVSCLAAPDALKRVSELL